ncbi:hypothetical protein TGAMA5MH_04724 [Trichoderma gamsii]|uniref:Uncharacterized protein n=1 Tax=Trichoderma gamsii TaxID=398673 RepID=A0A2K0TCN6_9HYPO|nr:hypothetical protein TGAMA5MH_04724 [Trichoderma gamsii]
MTAPNIEVVKEALMADLGRSRQDELPLSDRAKRPTYLPGRSGTSHIPQARKEQLGSKWGVKIVDEESEQMEGLELGNARPWAKLTNQFMARHAVESAPPRYQPETKPFRPFAIPKPPSSIRSTGSIGRVPASALPPASNRKALPHHNTQASRDAAVANSSKVPVVPSAKGPPISTTESKPNPSTPLQAQEHLLSQGNCETVNESDNSSSTIKFMLKVQLQKNKGLLVMQLPDKGKSVHDVLTLDTPVIQGPFCLVFNAQRERLYKLKFRTSVAAEGFQYLLKSLQQSALRFKEPSLVSPKETPTPTVNKAPTADKTPNDSKTPTANNMSTTDKETEANTPNTPSNTASQVTKTAPTRDHGNDKVSLQAAASTETSLQRDTRESVAGESLVDTGDDFPSNPALTIEAAADHMQGLVQQILSEITAAGIQVPEKGIEEIESTAISNWMAQGFMTTETESDELKEELAELLRLLVRIKRKVQFRHGSNHMSHMNSVTISSETLQDLQEIVEKPSKKIKYTPTDIKELEAQAVSRKDKINASGLHEIQKGSLPKKKTGLSIAKQKDKVPSSSRLKAAGGLATSRWASSSGTATPSGTVTPSGSATPSGTATPSGLSAMNPKLESVKKWINIPLKAPTRTVAPKSPAPLESQKPNSKGLSSSRWADKPVENEGKFAGF